MGDKLQQWTLLHERIILVQQPENTKYHIQPSRRHTLTKSSSDINEFSKQRKQHVSVLSEAEESSVVEYCLWASEQGINKTNSNVKACKGKSIL